MALQDDPKVQALVDKAVTNVKKQAVKALKDQHRAIVSAIKTHGAEASNVLKGVGNKEHAALLKIHTASALEAVPALDVSAFDIAA